ncbi:MAG: hypothetical protein ACRBFS_18260 [Aureispira sp.]
MNKLFYSLLFLFSSSQLLAECAGMGITLWPQGKTLAPNTILMIDGYAESQHIVNGLNGEHPIYLQSKEHKVLLEVLETLQGEFWITQAILKPKEALRVGQEYELVIENLPDYHSPLKVWNSFVRAYTAPKWMIVQERETPPPSFRETPKESKKILKYYGCGPEHFVVFDYTLEQASECLIRTTVTHLATQTTTTYYLIPRKQAIYVGHNMCFGAFELENGADYQVSFSLVNATGQKSSTTPSLSFQAATIQTD